MGNVGLSKLYYSGLLGLKNWIASMAFRAICLQIQASNGTARCPADKQSLPTLSILIRSAICRAYRDSCIAQEHIEVRLLLSLAKSGFDRIRGSSHSLVVIRSQ
jgi:hypothetical protein